MVYNILITEKNGMIGYLSIVSKHFCSTTYRQCVLWFNTKEKAEKIIKRLKKKWEKRSFEIKEHTKILR
ncbi:MAG: hypothetical protein J7L15_01030 [Clostridiales bacterium]|nr:hypothetical protein [Clostridiales bacterium]